MFQLDQAIDHWCDTVLVNRCGNQANTDEIKDHLYCVIEGLSKEGLSEQQAFNAATRQLGEAEDLMAEYEKNKALLDKLCAIDSKIESKLRIKNMDPKKAGFYQIVTSLVFAAAILVTAYLLKDTGYGPTVMFILIGLWVIPFSIINASSKGNGAKSEIECLRNYFRKTRKAG